MVKKGGPRPEAIFGDSVLHQLEMKELKGNCVYPPQHSMLPGSLTPQRETKNVPYSSA